MRISEKRPLNTFKCGNN